jgi:MtN3 and saliva related transmembrane protein
MLSKWFGIIGGLGTTTSFFPQVLKSLRSSSIEVSPLMLVIHFCGVSSWVVYGFLRGEPILVVTNSISAVLVGIIGVRYACLCRHKPPITTTSGGGGGGGLEEV